MKFIGGTEYNVCLLTKRTNEKNIEKCLAKFCFLSSSIPHNKCFFQVADSDNATITCNDDQQPVYYATRP